MRWHVFAKVVEYITLVSVHVVGLNQAETFRPVNAVTPDSTRNQLQPVSVVGI